MPYFVLVKDKVKRNHQVINLHPQLASGGVDLLLPVDGDRLGEDSEPAKGNGESVLFDLKNINKDAVHKIEAPIDATTLLGE